MPRRPSRFVACAAIALPAAWAFGADPFSVTLTEIGNSGNTVTRSGSSLIDLIDDAVNTQGADFQGFQNLNTNVRVNYAGVQDAIVITKNAANTQASVTFINGTTRTFNGTNQADLERQIEDYIKKDGQADVRAFLQEINKRSLVAVSDGNPNATTARFADLSYNRFGFFGDFVTPVATTPEGKRTQGGLQMSYSLDGGIYDAGGFEGQGASLTSGISAWMTERVGFSLDGMVAYNNVEGADVFHAGLQLGLPIQIIRPETNLPLTWQVTPSAVIGGSGSIDFAAGGLIFGGAATSHLAWDVTPRFQLMMANQFGVYEGQDLTFSDYTIDPGVSQQILKNGLKATLRLGTEGDITGRQFWYVYAGATATNFLEEAAVDFYWTPSVGLGWRKPGGSGFQVGYGGDFGDDFTRHQIRAAVNFAY